MKDNTNARLYLTKAKEILKDEALLKYGYYVDRKLVKLAGKSAYTGVLISLNVVFGIRPNEMKSFKWYRESLSQIDNKLMPFFLSAYDILYLSMGHDGNISPAISKEGIDLAEQIINWAEQRAVA